jgi:uncharacterized protein (TIGR00730 family)
VSEIDRGASASRFFFVRDRADKITTMRRICVFSGSSSGLRPSYTNAAKELGRYLAASRIELVYGGAKVGLMGAMADAALMAGGVVIGVIPEHLMAREVGHDGLTKMHVVGSMHERKALMSDLSDAFIALPGGLGTFEEFCEVVTWSQLGLHQKPCGLLNVEDYYSPLLQMFDQAVQERFLKQENRGIVLSHTEIAPLIRMMSEWSPVPVEKWIDRNTR